ncbi:hypothetical protein [Hafnia paralvei]|uniref:hypothetical protein n=1 Tax=Hafnia paralvei TaxID=546367 RepID=UPI0027B8C4C0|nr:hypothetical protein [Hafnia paralvei]
MNHIFDVNDAFPSAGMHQQDNILNGDIYLHIDDGVGGTLLNEYKLSGDDISDSSSFTGRTTFRAKGIGVSTHLPSKDSFTVYLIPRVGSGPVLSYTYKINTVFFIVIQIYILRIRWKVFVRV